MSYFAHIDVAYFFTKSIGMFFLGALGDAYSRRLILTISMTVNSFLFGLVGYGGFKHANDLVYV
jgi:MFS family permease